MAASTKKKKRFDVKSYKQENKIGAYEFVCNDDSVIELYGPDVKTLRKMQATIADIQARAEAGELTAEDNDVVLRALIGEHFDRVMEELGDCPAKALNDFTAELQEHFLGDVSGGYLYACELIEKYGPEIEADLLSEYNGVDLVQFFRGERAWGQLFRILEQLPPLSRYKKALADDDELAELEEQRRKAAEERRERLNLPGPDEDSDNTKVDRIPLSQWTPEREMAADLGDRLAIVAYSIQAANGGKPKKPKPSPRPMTARARLKIREDQSVQQDIIAIFSPR